MGLTDFSPKSQDLMAIEILRSVGVIEKIQSGDVAGAIKPAANKWAALPMGPGLGNRYPAQPYVKYEDFLASYHLAGGAGK
jgi:muramidase (phage lysozyme)